MKKYYVGGALSTYERDEKSLKNFALKARKETNCNNWYQMKGKNKVVLVLK
jgi:hypothetical protein